MLARNPVVHDSVVMQFNSRRSERVLKNSRAMIARQNVASKIAIHEMARVNVSKMIGVQAKGKTMSCRMDIEGQADAGDKSRARRQRRPAAIITTLSPTDPPRVPYAVRSPAPAKRRVLEPPAIMERRPAP